MKVPHSIFLIASALVASTTQDSQLQTISEILFNPPGSDTGKEYVELSGEPNGFIAPGTYLVGIEGDQASGDIQTIFDLSNLQIGSQGYLALLQEGHPYVLDPNAAALVSPAPGFSGLEFFSADSGGNIENASVTFLIVHSEVPPALQLDIDEDNDGIPDHPEYEAWTIMDSISVISDSAPGVSYSAEVFAEAGKGLHTANANIVNTENFVGAYVARIINNGSNEPTWITANVRSNDQGTVLRDGESWPPEYSGQVLNHIGFQNPYVPAPPPLPDSLPEISIVIDDSGIQLQFEAIAEQQYSILTSQNLLTWEILTDVTPLETGSFSFALTQDNSVSFFQLGR